MMASRRSPRLKLKSWSSKTPNVDNFALIDIKSDDDECIAEKEVNNHTDARAKDDMLRAVCFNGHAPKSPQESLPKIKLKGHQNEESLENEVDAHTLRTGRKKQSLAEGKSIQHTINFKKEKKVWHMSIKSGDSGPHKPKKDQSICPPLMRGDNLLVLQESNHIMTTCRLKSSKLNIYNEEVSPIQSGGMISEPHSSLADDVRSATLAIVASERDHKPVQNDVIKTSEQAEVIKSHCINSKKDELMTSNKDEQPLEEEKGPRRSLRLRSNQTSVHNKTEPIKKNHKDPKTKSEQMIDNEDQQHPLKEEKVLRRSPRLNAVQTNVQDKQLMLIEYQQPLEEKTALRRSLRLKSIQDGKLLEQDDGNIHSHVEDEPVIVSVPVAKKLSYSKVLVSQRRSVTSKEKDRALRKATNFTSKKPFFTVVMRPSYVYKAFFMYIPFNFVKKYISSETQDIILSDSNRRKWSVKCRVRGAAAGLGRGWSVFVEENKLEEDDVCVFELVKKKKLELKVSIFRVIKPRK
ncbi:B3 domain-containing protein [Acorus gramineus]|uniref:B3 domain-containing protein n=1 Tax=Acorus gramineus TaxID=55184 RepID=A0AAV9AVR8_ACOGR|nr:B3 domain-containing protein [Acorus gramineus]